MFIFNLVSITVTIVDRLFNRDIIFYIWFKLFLSGVDGRTSYFNQSQDRLFKNISSPKKLSCRKLLSAGQNRDCHLLLEEFVFVPMMDAVVVRQLVPACRRILLFRYLAFAFGYCSYMSKLHSSEQFISSFANLAFVTL